MQDSFNIKLYDSSDTDFSDWTDSEDGQYAKNFLLPLMKNGTSAYINNVKTRLMILKIDDLILPITINDAEYENSYVCSPYTHYISYAVEELKTIKNPFIELILAYLIRLLGIVFKFGKINKTVHINNWLLSTNLYPTISHKQIEKITEFLIQRFPEHSLIFRSVNNYTDKEFLNKFQENNYQLIPSRQIYFLNKDLIKGKAKWLIKKDFKLQEKSGYELLENKDFSPGDIPRIKELYDSLYLDKYSCLNPQFNENFLDIALKNKILNIRAFQKAGKIDAVLGYFSRNGIMTTPLFGYDTSLPMETGLYRMLSAQLIKESGKSNLILNQSSGAASFKRCRASEAQIEYSAVYCRHLTLYRRIIWSILEFTLNKIGLTILKKYKL